MHIGLIGGIGPAATIAYYSQLVAAFNAAGVTLELTIAHADIAKTSSNAAAGRKDEQAAIFANHFKQLHGAGCDFGMLTAMTAHFCFAETNELSPLPLISGTKLIDDYCRKNDIKRLGLLGSTPVLETRLFEQLKNVETVVPAGDLSVIGNAYHQIAHSGICTDENRALMFNTGSKMVDDQNADAVLLAGTDLCLAFDGHDPGYPVVDAVQVHVDALVKLAAD